MAPPGNKGKTLDQIQGCTLGCHVLLENNDCTVLDLPNHTSNPCVKSVIKLQNYCSGIRARLFKEILSLSWR
jgi:hypothetical protein